MDRVEKQEAVARLRGTFEESAIVVVTHYSGLTVAELGVLRGQMRDVGASFKVTKNRLTRLALEGTSYQHIDELVRGPTAIAYSADPVAAAKAAVGFAKTNEKLVVLGGAMGDVRLDADGIKALATLPSLDELRGKLVGLLKAPATKVAGVVQAPAAQVARVISARAKQLEAA